MKIFDSRKNIVMASMGVLFATLILVSCEKREEPLLNFDNTQTVFSKTVAFSARTGVKTRAFSEEKKRLNSGVLRNETSSDTLCLSVFESDLSLSDDFITRASEITDFTDNNFKVIAYTVGSEDNSTDIALGFNTEDANDNNFIQTVVNRSTVNINGEETTIWEPEHNYYWGNIPTGKSLQFFAYDNIDDNNVKTTQNAFPTIEYTVNPRAEDQKDILIAQSAKYSNATETSASLTFEHLLTAVQFEVDIKDEDQSYGIIKNLSINNIYMNGTYDFATKSWTYGLKGNSTIENTFEITSESESGAFSDFKTSFMVIPQLFPDENGATVSITFDDGDEKTLTAPLKGAWVAGKRYIYRISVTPYGDLDFTTATPNIQDAHYTICPITFTYVGEGTINWKLEANDKNKVVRYVTTLDEFAQKGYWIAGELTNLETEAYIDYEKASYITGSINSGNIVTVYAYFNENVTKDNIDVTFTLSCTDDDTDIEPANKTITQLCPTWNSDATDAIGCERIEDDYVPWGPYWTDENGNPVVPKATVGPYSGWEMEKNWNLSLYYWFARDRAPAGVTWSTAKFLGLITYANGVEIDYSSYLNLDDKATSEDGQVNTMNMTVSSGLDVTLEFENWLEASIEKPKRNYVETKLEESAIILASRKNKYYLYEQKSEQNASSVFIPILRNNDFVWYLPSISECINKNVISKNKEPHADEPSLEVGVKFWTSTAKTGSTTESVYYQITEISGTGEVRGIEAYDVRNVKHRARAVTKLNNRNPQ